MLSLISSYTLHYSETIIKHSYRISSFKRRSVYLILALSDESFVRGRGLFQKSK